MHNTTHQLTKQARVRYVTALAELNSADARANAAEAALRQARWEYCDALQAYADAQQTEDDETRERAALEVPFLPA
jgi:multidrug efflux pump subunit AcrA (membrane-fusion protein)